MTNFIAQFAQTTAGLLRQKERRKELAVFSQAHCFKQARILELP